MSRLDELAAAAAATRDRAMDFLRAAKPMLQNIVDDHARARGK